MPAASPSIPISDHRSKWRKRKREPSVKRQRPTDNDEDDDEEEVDAVEEADEADRNSPGTLATALSPVIDLRYSEVVSNGGQRISEFPLVYRRIVNRPHLSVVGIVATERSNLGVVVGGADIRDWNHPFLENISHGQLQALSAVRPDHSSLIQPSDDDKPSAYICTPPPLREGKGIAKWFSRDKVLVIPAHSDWFSTSSVHRLERQVVPHFLSGKSSDHTPERYVAIRNKIIARYLENPGKRLSLAECQGLVPKDELYDLSRIVRFLDHWGIINYLATSSVHRGLRLAGSLLREDVGGELQLQTSPLKSIDSLILFDRPKCSSRVEDFTHQPNASSSSAPVESDGVMDLDSRIRERLAEHVCNYCLRPLPQLHYQSQKEADVMLCSDCFHDAKFVTGHSSLDFVLVNSKKDSLDFDADSWTDEETLLLLEAIEKYNDNWNDIAEYVGTKSKAQCILHFLRLPVEDGLLENFEIPHMAASSNGLNGHYAGSYNSNSNGESSGVDHQEFNSGNPLPFANSTNPVMSLVTFLTSSIGPRVAASCANAALTILTNGDSVTSGLDSESTSIGAGAHGLLASLGHQIDGTTESQVTRTKRDFASPTPELVKYAAMSGLSASAMKVKLFADQEEREIQRQAATIINHQLKRLELKLKQFAEIETLLLKECEQAERMRQRLIAERIRMMSMQFGQPSTSAPASGGMAVTAVGTDIRLPAISAPVMQPNMSAAYNNNAAGRQQMSLAQRQQMFSLGPHLPLSSINPPSGPSQNVMFNSGMPNSSAANHNPFLRSSGNNQNIG